MRLLILGGSRFVGRHITAAALEAGWEVTLFNRGREDPHPFPDARRLIGERDGGLGALADGDWDAVVDSCGYVPRIVRASAELLADRAAAYLFISSASVYADKSQLGISEDAPLAQLEDPNSEDVEADYDGLKAACENVVRERFDDRATIVRPGLVVGPYDYTERFSYWVKTIAAGGEVVAPEPREQPTQVIDGRDLAAFVVRLLEDRRPGAYNAVGEVQTMEALLNTVVEATASDARLRWTSEQQLLDDGVEPWTDLPLWLAPGADPGYRGFLAMSNGRAKAAGLGLRPLEATIRDTLAWTRRG
ncbi:MAG: NAD-dependent epimerase/dehydratase family protein [Gaiellaceae bacterium]